MESSNMTHRSRSHLKLDPSSSSSSATTATRNEKNEHEPNQPIHPSFEIIKHKSFGTLMHELWIRIQGEFGLSMLETWEVVMIYIIVVLLMLLFYVAIFKYFPSHIKIIGGRAKYYLVGSE
ncbi:hypothetical protein MJO28_013411 [Puccinia striiformis f. sp. tritici]|uniref:Uncharacterized protein n=3 Tax=Puccinia striiformis TaxID=27350 RepID=A0A0L0UV27_9BASI|nr:hypothetical protein Pst134EA_024147 [Puccinia striiformis f. sp. tritici]KNE90796.1 hypothetical protein PSTG_15762 [Puccinia striiformis f. sp. tritici PST-78]POW15817.1 hypothetical protein PSTT_01875 [Puccinia striiformis]KAH9444568.1 hypothetical protein Pst134EB_024830 [Puccinia striiformis f. sp. tritici]KAH9453262.1 hypothetical protein Pst134EA_024147 [Puccinia striiformis f. sp. tritici]KAI7941126.1 hypothetical protein MJO28_013411 [Puccinia striiformis f. sp. tritici]